MSSPSADPTPAPESAQKTPPSLHRSLQRAFWIFGGVLVLVYALVHSEISDWQEDRLLTRQISLEFESYLARNAEALSREILSQEAHSQETRSGEALSGPALSDKVLSGAVLPPVTSRFFSVHLGEESLPPILQAQATALPPGIHEIHRSPTEGEDYLLAIRETATRDQRLYLLYDVRRFDEPDRRQSEIPVLLFACGVVFTIGLIWASHYSRKVLEPLNRLAETVAGEPRPTDLADTLGRRREPVEVANLSRAIEKAMRTINDFVRRERELTRHASHELRTPLTVIRGATELLRYESMSPSAEQRLQRIERSVRQMEELIETFLWLARRHPGQNDEKTHITPIIHRVVQSHRHLLGGRRVEVEIETDPYLCLPVHSQIISVVLANLVKNAFYSTQEGFVKVSGSELSIEVSDSGPGLGETSGSDTGSPIHNFTLVRELCERSGWRLELAERRPSGTVATIVLWPRQ